MPKGKSGYYAELDRPEIENDVESGRDRGCGKSRVVLAFGLVAWGSRVFIPSTTANAERLNPQLDIAGPTPMVQQVPAGFFEPPVTEITGTEFRLKVQEAQLDVMEQGGSGEEEEMKKWAMILRSGSYEVKRTEDSQKIRSKIDQILNSVDVEIRRSGAGKIEIVPLVGNIHAPAELKEFYDAYEELAGYTIGIEVEVFDPSGNAGDLQVEKRYGEKVSVYFPQMWETSMAFQLKELFSDKSDLYDSYIIHIAEAHKKGIPFLEAAHKWFLQNADVWGEMVLNVDLDNADEYSNLSNAVDLHYLLGLVDDLRLEGIPDEEQAKQTPSVTMAVVDNLLDRLTGRQVDIDTSLFGFKNSPFYRDEDANYLNGEGKDEGYYQFFFTGENGGRFMLFVHEGKQQLYPKGLAGVEHSFGITIVQVIEINDDLDRWDAFYAFVSGRAYR